MFTCKNQCFAVFVLNKIKFKMSKKIYAVLYDPKDIL